MTPRRRNEMLAGGVLFTFFAWFAVRMPWIQHNVDEGVNVHAAMLMQQGAVPFRDFIYQQPPLFLHLLTLFPTDDVVHGRLLSLVASTGTGWLLFLLTRRALGRDAAGRASALPVLAPLLYGFSGLHYWNILAMPTASMLFFALLALYLLVRDSASVRSAVLAGLCLCISVLFKPLSLALYVAIVAGMTCDPVARRRIVPLTAAAGVLGLSAWGFWHLQSEGAFTDLVAMQGSRSATGGLIESMRELPGFRVFLADLSARAFTWRLYRSAFGTLPSDPLHLDSLLVIGAVAGLVAAWRGTAALPLSAKVTATGWLVFPVAFSLVVWPLCYEHYHVLLLPALAFLTCVFLRGAVSGHRVRVALVSALVVVWMLAGAGATLSRMRDYAPVRALPNDTPLMAFDPTLNVLSGAPVACGATHWLLPPYGARSHGGPYEASRDHLIACLDAEPETRVAIHVLSPISLVLIDRTLFERIRDLPPERLHYLSEHARHAFYALFGEVAP